LGVLASWSVLASEMPRPAAWLLAAIAPIYAVVVTRRYLGGSLRVVVWEANGAVVRVDGAVVDRVSLHWRGPLASLRYRDDTGRRRHLLWWPDTLPAPRRRELRLAAATGASGTDLGSMAP